jgi:Aerotolerance regulator N-terminal
MELVNSIWLWGLSGLLIPIGIHLLSRREGKIIKFGSIRHLEETNSKQFKSIRLNELVLLLLRCLIITILVLFLAGFHFQTLERSGKWLIVESGLERDDQLSVLIDSLKRNGFQIKRLTGGFPDLTDSSYETKKINYWDLLSTLKKKSLTQAVVLSYNYADGFAGKRVSLPENVQWLSKNPAQIEFGLNAIRLSEDSIIVRAGSSNPDKTSFTTFRSKVNDGQVFFKFSKADSMSIERPKTISIQIVNQPTFTHDSKMIAAAIHAIDHKSPVNFDVEILPQEKFSFEKKSDWVIRLSDETRTPTEVNCIYFRKEGSNNLFEKSGISSWALTQRLNEQVALQQNLAVQLGLILTSENKYGRLERQKDKRVLRDELIWDTNSVKPEPLRSAASPASSEKYLMTLLLLVLLLERWTSFNKNQ